VEEAAPFTAEIDDYIAEKAEVLNDQGPAFPYTRGLWLVSQLVAAVNPHDLDAMDESLPFSKYTLDELLGRKHTDEEYKYYFDRNPHSKMYGDKYFDMLRVHGHCRQVVSVQEQGRREAAAGYVNGQSMRQQSSGSVGSAPHPSAPAYGAPPPSYGSAPPPPAYGHAPPPYGGPSPGQRIGEVCHGCHVCVMHSASRC
jgi:hypothetical protein